MENLKAEMTRAGVSRLDIRNVLDCSEKTVRNKLDDITEFTFPEAEKIRNELFPSLRLEYLFASNSKDCKHPQ